MEHENFESKQKITQAFLNKELALEVQAELWDNVIKKFK